MENLRQLLAVIAAAVLVLSVISSANFVSYSAFADDDDDEKSNSGKGNHDEEDDDNSGSSNNSRDDDDDDKSTSSNDEDDDEERDDDDDSKGKSDERGAQNHNATSSSNDDDEEDDDDKKGGKDEDKVKEERHEEERKVKLEVEDDGAEIEVELKGMTLADGAYDAAFVCDSPAVNMTFADSFEVEEGEGEFDKEITLTNGTYTGCQLEVGGTVVASFNTFTVADDDAEEKRKERRQTIVSTVNATKIHERHVNANPASPGNFTSGSDYTLMANGTAEDGDSEQSATVNATLSVWKSTHAIILLDITGGTAEIGNKTYDIAIGYALYSINGDVMRLTALVVDDSGQVLKLKLRGEADGKQPEFPIDSGDSLDLSFEGNSGQGRNNIGDWELELEGTIEAS